MSKEELTNEEFELVLTPWIFKTKNKLDLEDVIQRLESIYDQNLILALLSGNRRLILYWRLQLIRLHKTIV